jgi:D-aminopeptidase
MKKQIIIYADMEGASGIFEQNANSIIHGSNLWKQYGRKCITSDVLAVCQAANKCNIDEIMLYDGHYAGDPEYNVITEELPANVKLFDTEDRRFYWRRIRGQAIWQPFGLITVGQHARNGETNAYFPHTIQSPPIKALFLNERNISEIGICAYNFCGTKYIANIGCAASMTEAKEVTSTVECISVKDKSVNWKPSYTETFSIIEEKVITAIKDIDNKRTIEIEEPFLFSLEIYENYKFDTSIELSWKGKITEQKAYWEAPNVEMGIELFDYVRNCIIPKMPVRRPWRTGKKNTAHNRSVNASGLAALGVPCG